MVATTISALAAIPTTTLNDAQFENAYPYIGDLEGNVNEAQLLELFGQVVSIRVCKDQTRRSSLGCYVNFASTQDAAKCYGTSEFHSSEWKIYSYYVFSLKS